MLKSDIIWPEHRRYKSRTEWEPVGFFSDCLCNSKQFDLMLGFFSSSAINILSYGFAIFLYNGGKMRLIINDILSEEDRDFIAKGVSEDSVPYINTKDILNLLKILSERNSHFFDCLAWLIRNNRLEIKVIVPINNIGVSHTKSGIFYDGVNEVAFDGSCNFSKTALIDNIESITVSCSWDGNIENNKVLSIKSDFDKIIPPKNQIECHKKNSTPIITVPYGHFVYYEFASWEELIECQQTTNI